MDDLTTPIKETTVSKGITVSTIYMENLHDFMNTILEDIGRADTPQAQALRDIREKHRGKDDIKDSDGIPMFGPYYETQIRGGEHDMYSVRANSVSQALVQHEATIATAKAGLV